MVGMFSMGGNKKMTLANKKHFTEAGSYTTTEKYKLVVVAWLHTGASTPTSVSWSAGNVVINNEQVGHRNWSGRNANTYVSIATDVPNNSKLSWNWNENGGLTIYCFN